MGHSVLLVPVPELEPFVRGRTAHYDADYLSADPAFTHAHVTVLGPFVERPDAGVLDRVARIAASQPAFAFVLAQVATFPNGIIHALPEPDEPFRQLTRRFREEFPGYPPYAGAFPDPVPHLTLDAVSHTVTPTVTEASTRSALGGLLPVKCRAERLDLAWYEPAGCRVLHSWVLAPARVGTGG